MIEAPLALRGGASSSGSNSSAGGKVKQQQRHNGTSGGGDTTWKHKHTVAGDRRVSLLLHVAAPSVYPRLALAAATSAGGTLLVRGRRAVELWLPVCCRGRPTQCPPTTPRGAGDRAAHARCRVLRGSGAADSRNAVNRH